MQASRDIFEIWGAEKSEAIQVLAEELDEKPDTVYRWAKRCRIPELKWDGVIKSAASRGIELTPDELFRFNRSAPPVTRRPTRQPASKSNSLRKAG